ncbi:MAG: ATP-binding cassette domain-containing protein [Phycisphaeraceae bacterium]
MAELRQDTQSAIEHDANPARLVFDAVDLPASERHDTPLSGVSFELGIGEMMIVQTEQGHPRLPLADAILGLISPMWGTITLDGMQWRDLSPSKISRLRSQVGRVFDNERWVSGLTLAENVYLASRYHRLMPERTMIHEARRLCEVFDIPRLPETPVSQAPKATRQKVAWVRALLGPRRLIILERPLQGLNVSDAPRLAHALGSLREQGATIIWITDRPVPIDLPGMLPDKLGRVEGTGLTVEPGPGPLGGDS